jgi:cell division septation protein DedD
MIDSGLKQKISGHLSGKVPVIILTVFFSCLSFTLGYFVGKIGTVNRTETVLPPTETVPAQQAVQPLQGQVVGPVDVLKTNVSPVDQPRDTKLPEQQSPSGAPGEVKPAERAKEADVKPANESSLAPVQGIRPDASVKQNREDGLYAVQLGAFKNRGEAERFRAKYSKKGYKIYIRVLKAQKNSKIYKVKTGEFREKKDAEILSLKLKKTEGLDAFVTPARE